MKLIRLGCFGKSNFIKILLVILALVSATITLPSVEAEEWMTITLGVSSYRVEQASTPAERQSGLMHRQSLAQGAGMLFLYPRSGQHRIWMKNTLIPLQVIWIDEDFEVIGSKILKPCESTYCPSFGVDRPSRFILEINSNEPFAKAGTIVEGIPVL
ncbi:MAG: uncharacterized membrane protein (UPF0127 family) [Planctomycetota bacterium]|jgi:uncharacterized membrane protein (UPF0127 family)